MAASTAVASLTVNVSTMGRDLSSLAISSSSRASNPSGSAAACRSLSTQRACKELRFKILKG